MEGKVVNRQLIIISTKLDVNVVTPTVDPLINISIRININIIAIRSIVAQKRLSPRCVPQTNNLLSIATQTMVVKICTTMEPFMTFTIKNQAVILILKSMRQMKYPSTS
jgi:hypothetical protein